jgi:diguanylate cyclase (GGDEF)-like protein
MSAAEILAREADRLRELHALDLLDTRRDAAFDAVVETARQLLDVPIVAISLVDRSRLWFKAARGLAEAQICRSVSFCDHTVRQNAPLIIEDTLLDERFERSPLVLDQPHIRFYAGVPLLGPGGLAIGALCIMDHHPRRLNPFNEQQLCSLALLANELISKQALAVELRHSAERLERKREQILLQQSALSKQSRLLEHASSHAKLGAWERDLETNELTWSAGMFAMHDVPAGTHVSMEALLEMYVPSDRSRVAALLKEAEQSGAPLQFEAKMRTASGRFAWVRVVSETERIDGRAVRRFGMKQDITEQRTLLDQLTRLAERDDLTGLYNRRELTRHLAAACGDPGNGVALVLFDLDGFKEINDTYGHEAGDACLRTISDRLRATLEDENVIVARTGGDEFAVLLLNDATEHVEVATEEIASCAGTPVQWGDVRLSCSTSIGYSVRTGASSADELMRQADLALYESKGSGRNCARQFVPALQELQNAKTRIVQEVRAALLDRRLELFYQTKIDLRSGAHIGYEALLRMKRPDGSIATPGEFISALEDPHLSTAIGDHVVNCAIAQAAQWWSRNVPFVSIAVNLTAIQVFDLNFPAKLAGLLQDQALPPGVLELEITEGILLSTSQNALAVCRELKRRGFSIAFDDFGTGYASLTHLKDFPIDVLKIDRSFIRDLTRGGNGASIVNTMVALGINLSLTVVAEGVETEDEYEFLRAIGCEAGQGYFFGRPVPWAEAETQLRDRAAGLRSHAR